ncbi:SDR family oxidoreductase [Pseudothauera rhizosphaerae]|uniref:SDR family NAD(P)-dependent oxidoreductase n=1 Tax=Pseudothauera rhizosphaerae TaxID=2565932 RepID=A0A4S4AJ30_9RHOO|nr:SDR family NAD(P)-dependent oxidoreductase [Pseudothauera rhizosphaerae]THF59387.1 SDR family NAD(P)-dependent oxidoreductase [Pseudothauera rhizosphaerae]
MSTGTKLAIVTGAGSGIGAALTGRLVERGCAVLAVGRRAALLEALAERHAGKVEPLALDVGTEDAPARLVAALGGRAPGYVVHNAAVLAPAGPLADLRREAFSAHLQTNLLAPLFLTQALLPVLARGARILHVSSGTAHRALAGWGPYCISKSALHMLYQCWREEVRERGILVGSARPGVVDTPMQAQIRALDEASFPDVEAFRQLKENGQLATPDTVARFFCWLLFDADAAQFTERENDIRDAELAGYWQGA